MPVSLALLAAAVSFGPWGAYSVALTSQTGRLEALLRGNGLLAGGKVVKLSRELDTETRRKISGCLDYIVRYHGTAPLEKYFTQDLTALKTAKRRAYRGNTKASRDLMSYMGQEYLSQWARGAESHFSCYSDNSAMDLRGFDLAVKFSVYNARQAERKADGKYRAVLNGRDGRLRLFKGDKFVLDVPLGAMAEDLRGTGTGSEAIAQDRLSAAAGNGGVKVKAYFTRLAGKREGKGILEFSSADGLLLIKERSGV